ncbi:methyltransferase domain-containing protein [Conexibacter sp. SYSU D00693]|uniref:methyltransferase domain-containing protein n=1 Tax=Conexibacter sp. SYSU D00693 TaxID=2812560 RepID=UPI00196AFBD7|nr:methyltransferase domain-containing protein [Conexibacter sp. SYSU D00693]
MANPLTRNFLQDLMALEDFPDPVVEFGSMQVEDEQEGDLRSLFAGRDFVGTDFREGPGVDRVEDLRGLTFGDGEVGTAICLDTLEHCADPPMACRELARVTADGGICVISSVMLFGIHGYPNDYFRFTPEGFRTMLEQGFDDVFVTWFGHDGIPTWVFGVGVKGRKLGLSDRSQFPSLVEEQRKYDEAPGELRVGVMRHKPLELLRDVAPELVRLGRERVRKLR